MFVYDFLDHLNSSSHELHHIVMHFEIGINIDV